jgi:hypothetical protein
MKSNLFPQILQTRNDQKFWKLHLPIGGLPFLIFGGQYAIQIISAHFPVFSKIYLTLVQLPKLWSGISRFPPLFEHEDGSGGILPNFIQGATNSLFIVGKQIFSVENPPP